ncbi:hypothetical protein ACSSS7_007404 [Eimeria intestinalis]
MSHLLVRLGYAQLSLLFCTRGPAEAAAALAGAALAGPPAAAAAAAAAAVVVGATWRIGLLAAAGDAAAAAAAARWPRGMDKLIETENGATITNDGATLLQLLQVQHPAAALLVDVAQSQDLEVGDGTTSVVVLAGEFLQEAKAFVEEGMAPQIIVRGLRAARDLGLRLGVFFLRAAVWIAPLQALRRISEVEVSLKDKPAESRRSLLIRWPDDAVCLVGLDAGFFSQRGKALMVVDAVSALGPSLDISMLGVKKQAGGSYLNSRLVRGVAFKKTFSYAGFEQQPKRLENPKILLLNLELELKAEKENAEIRLDNPDDYQSIVDAEWAIIYEKLQAIVDSGAQVVFSKLPIAAFFYLPSDCPYRLPPLSPVEEADLKRAAKATGAKIQTTVMGLTPDVLGRPSFC